MRLAALLLSSSLLVAGPAAAGSLPLLGAGPSAPDQSTACPQGSLYPDGCAASPGGSDQHTDLLTGYGQQNGQTYATRPPWNVAGSEYATGVPPGTVLKDAAIDSLPSPCVYQPTGSPAGGAAIWCPSGNNLTLDAWDLSLHNCTYVEFGTAVTGVTTFTRDKIISGSNCDNPSNTAVQIKFDYPTTSLVMTSNTVDACGKVDAYCAAPVGVAAGAVVIYNARYGGHTLTYNTWLNVNGRFIGGTPGASEGSPHYVEQFNYEEGMVFNAVAPHGEFELFGPPDHSGLGAVTIPVVQYSYNTCVQPRTVENGLSGGGNATTACFYFSDGYAGAPPPNTFTQVIADHNTVITNGSTNPPGGSTPPFYVTTSAGMEVAWDIYTNVTFDTNYVDPTGSFFCFWSASSPVFTNPPAFTGNVDMIDGSAVNSFGTCPGAHP